MPSRLGKLIKEARQAQSLTLRELARRIGKSPTYLVFLERAEESPGIAEDTLKSLASTLGLDNDLLLASVQKIPLKLAPRSATQVALYRLMRELPSTRQDELRRQLEKEVQSRKVVGRRKSAKPEEK